MKENILTALAVIGFIIVAFVGISLLWGWTRAMNDVECKERYGLEVHGRTGYKGSPQCVLPDGTGKYL